MNLSDKTHPIWTLVGIMIVGGLGLGYCAVAYANGVDILKDGALIGLVGGIAALWAKFMAKSPTP